MKARDANLRLLVAAAQRTRIIILAQFQLDLTAAEELAARAVNEHQDPQALFLVKESLGRQYVHAKRFEDAARLLRDALTSDESPFEAFRLYAKLSLAEALSNIDKKASLDAAIAAVAYARRCARLPPLELVKALSEAGIAAFRMDGPSSAFVYLDEAGERLLASRTESEQWREVFVLVNYTTMYVQKWASNGRPPQDGTVVGEAVVEPSPGIFTRTHTHRHTYYQPEHETILRVELALFADTVNDDRRLAFWLNSALPKLSEWPEGDIPLLLHVGDLVVHRRYPDAVEAALSCPHRSIGALYLLMAATLQLCRTALASADEAERDAASLAGLMRAASTTAKDGALWTRLSNLIECGFRASPTLTELAPELGALATDDVSASAANMMLACKPAQTVEKIAVTHIHLAMQLLKQRQVFMQLHRQLLLPLMFEQWRALTNRAGFLFRNPTEIRAAVAAAEQAPIGIRAQQLLRDVTWALGMGTAVPADVKAWFETK